ncbi:OTU domain-containing protein 4 [Halichoeres trimaculatus]|uniref:OTU domain-containing protein 4 n=1 Tax=Halichoeres trimaculatus TaxID=147232 RepID=UPI003D9F2E0B
MDSMQSSEERGAEKQMDEYLKSLGFQRKKIAKDGSCLFRAVAEQVLHSQSLHTKVRAKCVDFLKQNRENYEAFIEGDFEEYLFKLQDPQQWVGEVEINALAVIYKRDFEIFQEPGRPAVNITENNFKDKVRLCFLNGNHYDSVYPVSRIKSASICQSILYELLYDDVLKVDRSLLSVCQRGGRPNGPLIDDNLATCDSSDESDADPGEPLWVENGTNTTAPRHSNRGRGRGRLSERVWRSLNPTLLRNIEYDVWHKSKRAQQKLDYSIAAGMQFNAGDRCQVRLEGSGRSYNATVKEVPPDNGPVTVYIEEVGKRQVPLWSLRPPCDENSWSTVVNRDKRLSNGHGDWEERGRGRGRGKHVPASSTAPAATALGSTGRVQKQHSWPPQTTAEEPGGAKSTRKSASSVEPPFGLTEKQRLAKEEEERNVALVEIQLRDEQSFPALGSQSGGSGDGGRKRGGGDKRRFQRNKTKSPVEDVRAPSPSAGERPKSSTPPLTTAPPPADADSTSTFLSSDKASLPKTNMAASSSDVAVKPSAPSYASAAGAPPTSASSSAVMGGAVPSSASLFSFITPVLPPASSPQSPHTTSSSSPPPPSSSSPPTFIAPIAPSPSAAQSFLHPSSLPRSSPPLPSLPHSPSPPPLSSSPLTLTGSQTQNQTPLTQADPQVPKTQNPVLTSKLHQALPPDPPNQTTSSVPQNQTPMPQTQVQTGPPEIQTQPESSTAPTIPQPHDPPQSQPEVPLTQPPPPSQVPHPSPSMFPPQTQTEAPQPPPESPPQSLPPPPPQPSSLPVTVPLQQLSQLYQDPLYPGFPQGENGQVLQTPVMSSSRSGDDLPQDVNVLRFFFNLGVKAYSMHMFPPNMYLFPLLQAHAMSPKIPSRSPSPSPNPQYPPPNPPPRPQESYPPPQYPPTSSPMHPHYDHQAPPTEPPSLSDPSHNQAGYPPPHRMPPPWQQHQIPPPRNQSFPLGYPSQNPTYSFPPPISQGYQPGHSPGHPLYPPSAPYPSSSMGYQVTSSSEELHMSQGAMEQHQPPNGDPMLGPRPLQATSLLGSPPIANLANASNSLTGMLPVFGHMKEHGEGLNRALLTREPPVGNHMLVPNPGDSSTTMKPLSTPGSLASYETISTASTPPNNNLSYGYRSYAKPQNPANTGYELNQMDYLMPMSMTESVGCSTEDDWDEQSGFRRGPRRYPRGRGRGSYDPGRGMTRRRHGGAESGTGFSVQFYSSNRGRGRERGGY